MGYISFKIIGSIMHFFFFFFFFSVSVLGFCKKLHVWLVNTCYERRQKK